MAAQLIKGGIRKLETRIIKILVSVAATNVVFMIEDGADMLIKTVTNLHD
ncbi:MAG TPA: hypothetical protein VN426_05775 [Syntrophomonadaceae bacterium]|nr:hypothetical protein [Syntrophomonadaceae bacterium]